MASILSRPHYVKVLYSYLHVSLDAKSVAAPHTHAAHSFQDLYSCSWPLMTSQGPVSLTVFHRNSNSMEISFHSHLDSNTAIVTKFCTWHDSCAVVSCAKICCDLMVSNGITARRSFHRIRIAGKKSLVKWAPHPEAVPDLRYGWKHYPPLQGWLVMFLRQCKW